MSTAAESLAREVSELRRRLAALERGPQLSRSTIQDADGVTRPLVDSVRAGITAGAQAAEAIEAATSALAKADGAVESFFGADEPEGGKIGDLWRKPNGEVLQHDGKGWAEVTDPQVRADLDDALDRLAGTEGALDGKISTYFAALLDPPRAAAVGDLWIVSDMGNLLRRWDGREWVDARDAAIEEAVIVADKAASTAAAAQEAADSATTAATTASATASNATTAAQEAAALAATAQAEAASAAGIADGKGDVLIQAATPTEAFRKATTLWIDTTSSANTPKRWNGTTWVAVTDKKAADAATAATNAAKAATAAQTSADTAATAAADAATAAKAAKDRADAAHTLAGTAESNAQAAISSAAGAAEAARLAQGTADTAKGDAASAAGLADGKADVLIQATAPAADMQKSTTLWIDTTSNANTPKRWSGTAWAAVTDKKATDAATAASNAQKAADAAKTAADTVSKNLFSTATPSGTAPYGSTWFRVNSSGQVIGQWQQTAAGIASTWTVREIRSEVIANLDVGKVTAGTLAVNEAVAKKLFAEVVRAQMVEADEFIGKNAILKGSVTADKLEADLVLASRVIAGDATGTRAEMSPDGFRVFAANPDATGSATEVVRMGVASTDDYFAVSRADGSLAATISQDGIISAKAVYANESLYYQGDELSDVLTRLPKGVVALATRSTNSPQYDSASLNPYLHVTFPVEAGRLYRISTNPLVFEGDGSALSHLMWAQDGPAVPGTAAYLTRAYTSGSSMGYAWQSSVTHNRVFRCWWTGSLSILLAIRSIGSSKIKLLGDSGYHLNQILVEDVGILPQDTGEAQDGTAAKPPTKQNYETTWTASATRSYQGSGAAYNFSTDKMFQGLSPAGYGNLSSCAVFPDMTAALSGATINSIQVYLYFDHWYYNNGGTARIGLIGKSLPATFKAGGLATSSGGWPKPGGRWVNIPSNLWNGFKTGQWGGISLNGDSTYGTYGYANNQPKIKINYTK